MSIEDLARSLNSDLESGLAEERVEKALARYGPNVLPQPRESLYRIYIAPLLNLLIDIYIVMSTLLLLFALLLPGLWAQLAQWFGVIALNALVAIVQQARARKQMGELLKLTAAKCRVLRAGQIQEIPAEQLVPGDIIQLEPGDRIPGDARLFRSSDLRVNESTLTGEPTDVQKSEQADPSSQTLPKNEVYVGTVVTGGSGVAIVTTTGKDTELGRISSKLQSIGPEKVHLRREINTIAKYLSVGVVSFLAVSLTYQFYLSYTKGDFTIAGIPVLVAAVVRTLIIAMSIMPMNIPLLTTIILVTGVLAMARRNVVVRDLNSVETFSRVSVACTDKTGTLTKGEMTVRWLCFPSLERVYGVTGVGLDPRGNIVEAEPSIVSEKSAGTTPEDLPKSAKLEADSPLWYMVVSGFMNNTSLRVEVPGPKGKIHKWLGNLTDVALAVLFAKSGLDEGNCKSRFSELRSFSFDSKLKRMTRVYKDNRSGEYIAFTKGATELLLPLCTWTAMDSFEKVMPLDEKTISKIVEWTDSFASRGHRVVSFCYKKNLDLAGLGESRETVETNLAYLGFVAILDPPRVGVRESVSDALRAGVRPVMVTGDNSETARSIAQEVGISQTPSDQIITGVDLQSSSDDEFLRAPVFARVSPEDKLLIVRRYQKLGRPLSMTGDGVNDALAISAADIGVAMGQTGTDVAKQAADIVLADDSFSSVVQGIRVGRGTFQKIRSIIFFYIAVNFAEALVYFGSGFIPQFSLLNSWQHIFVFITAHSLPPFAIIADYLNKDVMREKPKETEGIFTRRLLVALMIFAISMAGLLYLGYFGTLFDILGGVSPENKLGYAPSFNPSNLIGVSSWEQAKARTLLIAVALISESLLVISLRRINKTIPQMLREEPWWPAFPLVTLPPLALLALVYFPSIQTFLLNSLGMNFELIRLSFGDWGLILLLSIIPVLFVELYKLYLRERGKQF